MCVIFTAVNTRSLCLMTHTRVTRGPQKIKCLTYPCTFNYLRFDAGTGWVPGGLTIEPEGQKGRTRFARMGTGPWSSGPWALGLRGSAMSTSPDVVRTRFGARAPLSLSLPEEKRGLRQWYQSSRRRAHTPLILQTLCRPGSRIKGIQRQPPKQNQVLRL